MVLALSIYIIRRALMRMFVTKQLLPKERARFFDSESESLPRLEWVKMLDRIVCLHDGSELGKIEALNKENVVVKKGAINPTRYYFSPSMLRKQHSGKYIVDATGPELLIYQRNTVPNPSSYVTLGCSYLGYIPHIDDDGNGH